MKRLFRFLLITTSILTFQSCYYDNEETLYPVAADCDTLNVTYSATIAPIMNTNCNFCHGGSSPLAGINTDSYSGLKDVVDNGRLWGAINHNSGFSPMPKDRPKLSDCNLDKIRIWIDEGALNN